MYTGLRQGEQWSLLLADVKVDDATGLHVIVRYGARGRATKATGSAVCPSFRKP